MEAKHVSQEIAKLESALTKEAKAEEKQLSHAEKALQHSQKDHNKIEKAAHKADVTLEKTVKKEMKTAEKLNAAAHTHDKAVSDQKSAEHTLQLKKKSMTDAERTVAQRQADLDAAQQRHAANETQREQHLAEARNAAVGHEGGGAQGGPLKGM